MIQLKLFRDTPHFMIVNYHTVCTLWKISQFCTRAVMTYKKGFKLKVEEVTWWTIWNDLIIDLSLDLSVDFWVGQIDSHSFWHITVCYSPTPLALAASSLHFCLAILWRIDAFSLKRSKTKETSENLWWIDVKLGEMGWNWAGTTCRRHSYRNEEILRSRLY